MCLIINFLAIGRSGQNAKLAAKLTGWRIDIKSETQQREEVEHELLMHFDDVLDGDYDDEYEDDSELDQIDQVFSEFAVVDDEADVNEDEIETNDVEADEEFELDDQAETDQESVDSEIQAEDQAE